MDDVHLVTHGLAISQIGSAQALADMLGMDPGQVGRVLRDLVSTGRASGVHGRFILTPASRMALDFGLLPPLWRPSRRYGFRRRIRGIREN